MYGYYSLLGWLWGSREHGPSHSNGFRLLRILGVRGNPIFVTLSNLQHIHELGASEQLLVLKARFHSSKRQVNKVSVYPMSQTEGRSTCKEYVLNGGAHQK
jgi:hypothetical protein